jgi:outer membrane protein
MRCEESKTRKGGARVGGAMLFAAALAAGCASELPELAPANAQVPWPVPAHSPLAETTPPGLAIEPEKRYELAELIDLAERSSPKTRIAWEQARQAAFAVGIVESQYLPQLSAEAIGGFQRTPLPIPTTLIRQGYFTTDTREIVPSLAVKWLLFDFGRRANAEQAARETSFVANVAFNGEHERLVFSVSRDYFALVAAADKLMAAERALSTSQVDLDAVSARRSRGLATVVDLAQAQRQVARAQFDATRAKGNRNKALATLIATIGLPPLSRIAVADTAAQQLPADTGASLEQYLTTALADRPDILAGMGKVRSAQAELDLARAAYRPTIGLDAKVYENIGALSTQESSYYSVVKPGTALFLNFSWPLFDGGLRKEQMNIAHSQLNAAQESLQETRDAAGKEVADAYIALETGLAENKAAQVLVEAARTSHEGVLESYNHGLAAYNSLVDSENALVQAETDLSDARSTVYSAAAALAFATGHAKSRPGARHFE